MSEPASPLESQDETLDVDHLIMEIERRSPLWDKCSKAYSDRILKTRLWEEVCQNVIPKWDEYSNDKKKKKDAPMMIAFSAIDSSMPQNATIHDHQHRPTAANAPEAVPLFFDYIYSKLNSSSNLTSPNLTSVSNSGISKGSKNRDRLSEKPVRATDFLLWINGSNVPISISDEPGLPRSPVSHKRSRRRAQEENPHSELPRWPGMPRGALRMEPEYLNLPTVSLVKKKILSMMLQSMYSAQERLWPMEPVVRKYEHLTPYRMAFIFMKLDQLVHESHSILIYLERQTVNLTMTQRLQLYSHLMRRNIDVTYLVDYISQRVPRDQEVRVRQYVIRKEQEKMMDRWSAYAAQTPAPRERPEAVCVKMGNCEQ